jgi:hypothetical protein
MVIIRIIKLIAVVLSVFHYQDMMAINYFSRQDGSFTVGSTWSQVSHSGPAGSAPCNCLPCNIAGNHYLEIDHHLTISCNISFSGNPTVKIRNGGSLSVTGNSSVSGAVIFIIEQGASMSVSGNMTVNGGGGYITIDGYLSIGGNFTINGSYPVCGTGTISIGGSLSGSGEICGSVTVLPVSWLFFQAAQAGKNVKLTWATASELNNDYFTVERSIGKGEFISLGTVSGAGTSTVINYYRFTDENPAAGENFYRIRQTDFNGSYSYSNTLRVFFKDDDYRIVIFPNCIDNGKASLHLINLKGERIHFHLINKSTQIVMSRTLEPLSDAEIVTLDLPEDIKAGIYFLRYESDSASGVCKLVVTGEW